MKLKEVEKYKRLPDKSGAIYDAIEDFKPKSYLKLEKEIRDFLNYSSRANIKNDPPISAEMLVAPWGVGKTTTYDKMIKEILKDEDIGGFSIKIIAQEISNYYDYLSEKEEFQNFTNDGDRFLFILAKLLLKKVEYKKKFPTIVDSKYGRELIIEILEKINAEYDFFLIFIDELEEVLKNENNIIPFILKALKTLLNGISNIIDIDSNPSLIHFLSFLISCTDSALYEIARHDKLVYEYGGIQRRIQEKKILGISLEESIEYLVKLNKFSYNGKFSDSFTNPGASFNVLARMTMKNTGFIKSFFTNLMNSSQIRNKKNLMTQINGKFLIENSKDFTLTYLDSKRKSINNELYNNWLKKFNKNKITTNLIFLFFGEIKIFSLNEIIERFNEEIFKKDILKAIREFNQYIYSIHPHIKKSIIQVNLFKKQITQADIENILKDMGIQIKENENSERIIKFPEESLLFDDFLDSISYYEIDDDGEINRIFFFSTDKEVLNQIFPYLESETINILKIYFEKYLDIQNIEYYTLNPSLFSIIFPLPMPHEYNILNDKSKNANLWTEISRTRKSELFDKSICEIISIFSIQTKKILENTSGSKSRVLKVDAFDYFQRTLDKNKFLILENFKIDELSKNPLNIMVWRESGDYDESVMNYVNSSIRIYQREELKNIHLIILISQRKISTELIEKLSKSLEFTVVEELLLDQFEITKFAFLYKTKDIDKDEYDVEKFDSALEKLVIPFNRIIEDSSKKIEEKGLNIELKTQMGNLSEIPQLLKFVLYDFKSDYNNWNGVELNKPFSKINPIGLSPHYSSSLDDWGQKKLKDSIENYLIPNSFLKLDNNSLKVTMPKIQSIILNLIKNFNEKSIILKLNDLRNFFFETTKSPTLLNEVFLKDLENRGLIKIKRDNSIELIKINDSILKKKYKELKEKVNLLNIKDKDFYHIFSIKQKDYRLIFLKDFIDTLDLLINLNDQDNQSEEFLYIRQILFHRIHEIIDGIIDYIFGPLDVELSTFEEKLKNIMEMTLQIDYVNTTLSKIGFKNINIENFNEIIEINKAFSKIINNLKNPTKRKVLRNIAITYYNNHKTNVKLQSEDFSYLKLDKNKLNSDFQRPFLNLNYKKMLEDKEDFLKSPTFQKVENIKRHFIKIEDATNNLKLLFKDRSFTGDLANLMFKKIKILSKYESFEIKDEIKNMDQIIIKLGELKKEIDEKIYPIKILLERKRAQGQISLLDQINRTEISIKSIQNKTKNIIDYLKQKDIIKNEDEVEGYTETIKDLDLIDNVQKIEDCDNLEDLLNQINNSFVLLKTKHDSLKTLKDKITDTTVKFFKKYKDIKSLKRLFMSFKLREYAKLCDKYLQKLQKFYDDTQDFDFKAHIDSIFLSKKRIDEGYEKVLKKKLDEDLQNIFLELNEHFAVKGWFNETELKTILEKFKLNNEEISKIIDTFIQKDLIIKSYRFK